jgi:hypothetical protein
VSLGFATWTHRYESARAFRPPWWGGILGQSDNGLALGVDCHRLLADGRLVVHDLVSTQRDSGLRGLLVEGRLCPRPRKYTTRVGVSDRENSCPAGLVRHLVQAAGEAGADALF